MQSGDEGLQVIAAVMAAADAFLRESRRLFAPFGLTAAQYNVLNTLAQQAEGMSQRELGDVLVVDRSNVTGLLDRMGKAGWVKRKDDPADRRIYRVVLTAAGRRLWEKVNPRYLAVVAQVTASIGDKRLRDTRAVLTTLEASAATWTLPSE